MRIFGIALGLFLLFFSLSPGQIYSHDANARLAISRQLWLKKSVFIPDGRAERFIKIPNGTTTYFGIGQSLLFIPFDMLGYALSNQPFTEKLPVVFLYAPLVGLLLWWAAFLIAKALGLSKNRALLASTLLVTTTILLVYISQSLQEEAILAALVLFSFYFFIKQRSFASGFFAGLCFLFRLNAVFALLPIAGIAYDQRKERKLIDDFKLGALGFIIPFSVALLFNYLRFQNPFEFGYGLAYKQMATSGVQAWRPVNLPIAFSLLFGPGKGFFILSPPLFIALLGIFLNWRKNPGLWTSLFVALIGSVLFHSTLNGFSCGGQSWGGRFQVHLVGLFIYPFWLGVEALWKTLTGKIEVLAFLILGLFFQIVGVFAPESLEYFIEFTHHGDYKERLVTSLMEGQLPLRLQALWGWLFPHSAFASLFETILPLRASIPSFWGPAFGLAPIWVLILGFALSLVAFSLTRKE